MATKNLQVTTYMAIGKATIKTSIGNEWVRRYNDAWVQTGQSGVRNIRVYFEIDSEILDYSFADLTLNFNKVQFYSGAKMKLSVVNEQYNSKPDFVHPSITTITDLALTISNEPQTITVKNVPTSKYGYCLSFVDVNLSDIWQSEANMTSTYATVTYNEPNLKNIVINGNNIENATTITWETDYQDKAVVNVKNASGTILATKSVTIEKSCTFNIGDIREGGVLTFEVIAYYKRASQTVSAAKTLIKTVPNILSLEPNNVNQNVDNDINISWVSTNQQNYKLEIDGTSYSGTTQNNVIIPKLSLSQGTKTVKLTIYHIYPWGEVAITEKTATFLGYGKPPTPTLTLKSFYNTSTPVLTWTSSKQVAYRLIIKKSSLQILDTDEIISSDQFYQLISSLENNTTYTVILMVKNQFNLWSNQVIGTFNTNYTVLNAPDLIATSESNGAIILKLNTNSENEAEYKSSEIWRREPYGDWVRIAYDLGIDTVYRDFYIASDVAYEYKARNIATSGGISESDIITATSKVKHYTLFNVEDTSNSITFKNDVVIAPKYNQNITSNVFAGNEKPTTEQGKEGYYEATITFKTKNRSLITKLINLIRTSKVLLFKDCRGHKWFGNIVGGLDFPEDSLGIITVTLKFLETNFLERDVYNGTNSLYLLKFDGTWMFDGAKEFNGVG